MKSYLRHQNSNQKTGEKIMVITEGEGAIVGDDIVLKENGKKQPRVYVHFWPKSGTRAHALEMDAATYKLLYELRMQQPLPGAVLRIAKGVVKFDGEILHPPEPLMLIDLNLVARIRTMAEGTQYEAKALGYIEGANGDTLELVQVAEALASALATASAGGQTAVAPS
jgi:hypothetical protein